LPSPFPAGEGLTPDKSKFELRLNSFDFIWRRELFMILSSKCAVFSQKQSKYKGFLIIGIALFSDLW
jgi:hypothetical protein